MFHHYINIKVSNIRLVKSLESVENLLADK